MPVRAAPPASEPRHASVNAAAAAAATLLPRTSSPSPRFPRSPSRFAFLVSGGASIAPYRAAGGAPLRRGPCAPPPATDQAVGPRSAAAKPAYPCVRRTSQPAAASAPAAVQASTSSAAWTLGSRRSARRSSARRRRPTRATRRRRKRWPRRMSSWTPSSHASLDISLAPVHSRRSSTSSAATGAWTDFSCLIHLAVHDLTKLKQRHA
eukprot:366147-Chlamydomonas_euryale.AAC.11